MNLAHLHHMANQIALNFAAIGHANAVAATADHLVKFWDPRMTAAIIDGDRAPLAPIAREAVALLAQGIAPPPQTRATVFNSSSEGGRSDAG